MGTSGNGLDQGWTSESSEMGSVVAVPRVTGPGRDGTGRVRKVPRDRTCPPQVLGNGV